MTAQEIFNLIKDIRPGVWKIGLTYQKDLTILKGRGKGMSPAEAAGIAQGDIYKVVFRWCSANVNKDNTKAAAERRAARDAKIANGEPVRTAPSGFHKSDVADELNIIEYRDGSDEPCLVLKKGPHPDKVQYFLKGQEISREDIEDLINQKVVSKTALHELEPNEVFYLYPDKVQSLKIDGILHEEWEDNMNEAMFNGIALPNEDGFMDVEEELCEDFANGIVYDERDRRGELARESNENLEEATCNETTSTGKYNMKQQFYPNKSHPGLNPNKSHPGPSIVSGSTNETDPHEKVADRLLRIIKDAGTNGISRIEALKLAGYNDDLAERPMVGNSIFTKLQNQGLITADKDMLYINESLDEGARAKYVANQLDKVHAAHNKAQKLRDMSDTAVSQPAANDYLLAAAGNDLKGQRIYNQTHPYMTATDNPDFAVNDLTKELDGMAASRFKQDFHSHDTDRLAQRKPGSFAKESLEEAVDDMYSKKFYVVGLKDDKLCGEAVPVDSKEEGQKVCKDKIAKGCTVAYIRDHNDKEIYKLQESLRESVKQSKQKLVITEAMDHAARKNGYRNYKEYLNANK